ncbi:nitrogen regulation protein NR(II) [Paenibacillus bouchesdurhonensis]|uniref:PAS domain-containing protein n=1 Tax=Paenibacillus bouchesdurhonensis TaxID=1870990 RepID=UPI000DA6316C|nr:PAS domain-containing protein [Paenibacillus bouchesdurhonensis]
MSHEPTLWISAAQSLNQALAITDAQGTIQHVNPTWTSKAAQLGLSPLWDRPGINLIDFLKNPDNREICPDAPMFLAQLSNILHGDCASYSKELHFHLSLSQEAIWFQLEVIPLIDQHSSLINGIVLSCIDTSRYKRFELQLVEIISQIRTLRGLLPICAVCKRIKDEENHWDDIENFLIRNTHAEFTHDICPDCIRVLYPKYSSFLDQPDEEE